MARPTDDPKHATMTVRLSEDDRRALARLASVGGCSPSEALRRLLRGLPAASFPVPDNIEVAEDDIAALEQGAKLLSDHATKRQGKVPDEDLAGALLSEIGRIKFAAWFLGQQVQAKKLALAKAKRR
jgi:hypothetical protein